MAFQEGTFLPHRQSWLSRTDRIHVLGLRRQLGSHPPPRGSTPWLAPCLGPPDPLLGSEREPRLLPTWPHIRGGCPDTHGPAGLTGLLWYPPSWPKEHVPTQPAPPPSAPSPALQGNQDGAPRPTAVPGRRPPLRAAGAAAENPVCSLERAQPEPTGSSGWGGGDPSNIRARQGLPGRLRQNVSSSARAADTPALLQAPPSPGPLHPPTTRRDPGPAFLDFCRFPGISPPCLLPR